eukprot:27625_3
MCVCACVFVCVRACVCICKCISGWFLQLSVPEGGGGDIWVLESEAACRTFLQRKKKNSTRTFFTCYILAATPYLATNYAYFSHMYIFQKKNEKRKIPQEYSLLAIFWPKHLSCYALINMNMIGACLNTIGVCV